MVARFFMKNEGVIMKTITQMLSACLKVQVAMLIFIFAFSTACHRNEMHDEPVKPIALKAKILISDVSANNCLNLEKLNTLLQNPQFDVPAAIMTTNFKPLNSITQSKTDYFSYSSFYYRVTKANDLNLFTTAHQSDCQSIQLLTASNEVLTYTITEHSENQITFVLSDVYPENIPDYQKKKMADRLEPYEYTLTYVSSQEIKLIEKFRSIDPLCDEGEFLQFETTKNISWTENADGLPKQYQIDPLYLAAVQQSLPVVAPPVGSEEPVRSSTNIITVEEILKIMLTPIRDELELCS